MLAHSDLISNFNFSTQKTARIGNSLGMIGVSGAVLVRRLISFFSAHIFIYFCFCRPHLVRWILTLKRLRKWPPPWRLDRLLARPSQTELRSPTCPNLLLCSIHLLELPRLQHVLQITFKNSHIFLPILKQHKRYEQYFESYHWCIYVCGVRIPSWCAH